MRLQNECIYHNNKICIIDTRCLLILKRCLFSLWPKRKEHSSSWFKMNSSYKTLDILAMQPTHFQNIPFSNPLLLYSFLEQNLFESPIWIKSGIVNLHHSIVFFTKIPLLYISSTLRPTPQPNLRAAMLQPNLLLLWVLLQQHLHRLRLQHPPWRLKVSIHILWEGPHFFVSYQP